MKNLHLNLLALLIVFIGLSGSKSFASHIPGANITYTCDPANPLTYVFTFTIFRVCPGTHPNTMSPANFTLTNSCGEVNPAVPTFNQVGVAEDVNQLCASAVSNCNGGTQPGVLKYTYESTITLPANCDSWNLAFELCCRDASSNLIGGTGNDMACSTILNTLTAPCNSSPVVTAKPIPYACTNINFNYCLTIADPEGDSTYFSMVAPAGNAQTPIASLAGFTANSPLNGFVLDPLTGCMSFNHPNIGNYVVAIQINSFDAAGNLIASIIHDFQIFVIACTNTPPTNPTGGITNISGTGSQTGPNSIAACFGDNICFDVVFQDLVDAGNNITITQDGTTLLPGATFTQTGTNPATGTFCWLSQPGYTGNVVTFIAEDDGCPVMGTSGFAVNFNITTGVYAGTDQIICEAQVATLAGSGSGLYTWFPATGLSCTNCQNPTVTLATTTTYTVTGNLTGVCANTDQVTINIDNSNSVVASNDTTYCLGDPAVNLNAQFMINGVPSLANTGLGSGCYDQTITYTNPALSNGINNYNFAGTPPVATGGTLTITAYGDTDGAAEFWTIQDESSINLGTAGGSLIQCGTTHIVVIPLTAVQLNAWSANGSIDFAGIDVGGQVNATLCGVGDDLLGLRLQIDCPTGSGYDWTPITGLSNPATQNPTVTPTGPITYVVKVTGGTCDAYDTVKVVMCSVLPVEMLSFDAVCKEGITLINWSTATEINNDYFTIEKSSDALSFKPIGTVNGSGNSSTVINYNWVDNQPLDKTTYYRLKQTDFNGDFEYHGIKSVNCDQLEDISIYPNPFATSFTVQLSENSSYPLTIEVVDYLGRTVYSEITNTNLTEITLEDLPRATYYIKVFDKNSQVVKRIVKMK